jgi:tetratricopeptide (TPR) repeat protein
MKTGSSRVTGMARALVLALITAGVPAWTPSVIASGPAVAGSTETGSRSAPPTTPEAAVMLVVRQPWDHGPLASPEQVAAARTMLEEAAKNEPANARWAYGLGHVARLESFRLSGKAAEAKRKESKEQLQKVASQEPGNPDYQYWFGYACFEMIDDVGVFSKASLASTGRKAFEKTIELDPRHVKGHYALGTFYMKAPGIAGGSTAKAKAEGEALLKLPGGAGEYWGHTLLAEIATREKDWATMSAQYTAAETGRGDGADPLIAMMAQIAVLLNQKKDPQAALPVVMRYRAAPKADPVVSDFLEAEIRRQLGQCDQAVPLYLRVLAEKPDGPNSRFALAQCYETLGRKADAKREYDEFARRFPADARAAKAREAAKRLG